jgi:hypothetical protein
MAILTAEQILAAQDMKKELVKVPEWGGEVYVRAMTGTERDQFEASMIEQVGDDEVFNRENFRAKLASLTICDEKGNRLFKENQIELLGKKNAAALQRVFVVAQALSGIGDKDIEELTKKLKKSPFGDSASNSPDTSAG